ncbi:helix-turn-helix transcriptional regulator [Roseibium aestuarii]|uniref:Response regulator transcription factor n=1 Tax=Roseibium aestuarii TaxID=2600299 RepID=A0ABW4JTH8_9HYPH|nr:helix-turn-helix transcriptional regulator [Roseibium aestuarii]
MQFDAFICDALDLWSNEPENAGPAGLAARLGQLCEGPALNIFQVDLTPERPEDFLFVCLRQNLPSAPLPPIRIGEIPDQTYARRFLLAAYAEVRETGRHMVDQVVSPIVDRLYRYDRLILPQRTGGTARPAWALGLMMINLVLPLAPSRSDLTPQESTILQHLALGEQPKEIAPLLGVTRRSVEHRIQALKIKFGARNVTHLIALAIAQDLRSS